MLQSYQERVFDENEMDDDENDEEDDDGGQDNMDILNAPKASNQPDPHSVPS